MFRWGTRAILRKRSEAGILRMRHVMSVDATAINAIKTVYEKSKKQGIILILSGVRAQRKIVITSATK